MNFNPSNITDSHSNGNNLKPELSLNQPQFERYISGGKIDAALKDTGARVVAAAVVGGTVSQLTGGKFANGAMTAAFMKAYNDANHPKKNITDSHSNGNNLKPELSLSQPQFERGL